MSRLLRNLLCLEVAAGLLFASFFVYVGAGYEKWPKLIAALLPVFLCIMFYFRWQAAYSALVTYSSITAMCGVSYILLGLSLPEFRVMSASGTGLVLESVICVLIFIELMKKSTREWFRREQ